MEINEKNCEPFWNWWRVMKLWIINLQIQLKKQYKQTNKQNNLLILTLYIYIYIYIYIHRHVFRPSQDSSALANYFKITSFSDHFKKIKVHWFSETSLILEANIYLFYDDFNEKNYSLTSSNFLNTRSKLMIP